jgi:L-alanine-DL-glutamate epimerase-like enolase superfamily enzyme
VSVATRVEVEVERVHATAYTIPTDAPESDGTLEWDSTTIVVVEVEAGGERGLGYTYGPSALCTFISDELAEVVAGADALAPNRTWVQMGRHIRNAGRPGLGFAAVAAVDTALWDVKARLLELPLASLLGAVREDVPLYGSGGFTSYSDARLEEQLGGWADDGFRFVKMKVGRDRDRDLERVQVARSAIGDAELFVDANGALARKEALRFAHACAEQHGVTYFEEPVSSDDREGLRLLRDRAPQAIAAGEYAYTLADFARLVDVVDVLQADVTRCGGITGFLQAAALAHAHQVEFSAHTAPALHAHVCCAVQPFAHLEWFHDHVRIEAMLFDGVLEPVDGSLHPDQTRPGNGLELKRVEAERWRAS